MVAHFEGVKEVMNKTASLYNIRRLCLMCICIYTSACACVCTCEEINLASGSQLGFDMLIFFTNLNLREFPVKVSHSFLHFSVRDCFKLF